MRVKNDGWEGRGQREGMGHQGRGKRERTKIYQACRWIEKGVKRLFPDVICQSFMGIFLRRERGRGLPSLSYPAPQPTHLHLIPLPPSVTHLETYTSLGLGISMERSS